MGHTAGRLLQRGPESGEGMQQSKWMSLMGGHGNAAGMAAASFGRRYSGFSPAPFQSKGARGGLPG